jgi:hypothetical protein
VWVVNATPDRFTTGKKTRYPLHRRMDGFQGRSGRVRKISPTPGFDTWTVQPIASRYTGYAIPAHSIQWIQEADHSFLYRAEVKNEWCYTLSLPICLHSICRDKSTLCKQTLILPSVVNSQRSHLKYQFVVLGKWRSEILCMIVTNVY